MQVIPVIDGVTALVAELWQAYLWDSAEGLVLIDTGIFGADAEIADGIRQAGHDPRDVREIVLTHYHNDHRGSLRETSLLSGARALAHELDAPVIRGLQPQPPPNLTDEERPFAEAIIPRAGGAGRKH